MKKLIVIGAGIIGSSIAREIANRKLGQVIVIEKEKKSGEHASGRNSGVIHSGINQFPGTLKAKMCLEGSRKVRAYCKKHKVDIDECGTIVTARNKKEERALDKLLKMGKEVGVRGLQIINKKELERREPNVTGIKALFSPTGFVVDNVGFLNSIAQNAKEKGAKYLMDEKVVGIKNGVVLTDKNKHKADHIVNCAGLYADKIAHMMNIGLEYEVIPFRGEYMEVKNIKVNSMVYQIPDLRYPFLGVHFTKTIDGKVLAGPTAMLSFGRQSYGKQINFGESLRMIMKRNFLRLILNKEFLRLVFHNAKFSFSKKAFLSEIQSLCKAKLSKKDIKPYKGGIRAQMVDRQGKMLRDMLVEFRKDSTHVLNAVSPGLTSSLAFAEYVADNMKI